jgi:hypothetical protein
MDNPETLATLATQDEEKTEGAINNGQSRDTGNIGHTRRRENPLRLVCPMLPVSLDCPLLIAPSVFSSSCHKTKRKPKEQSTMDNPETLATLATQDEENTEGAINNGQSRDTGNSGHTRQRECLWIVHC